MTLRSIALVFAAMISLGSMALPDAALAQLGRDSCSKVCDCSFECLDFCSTESCGRPSACKRRVAQLEAQCKRLCQACTRSKASKKK
jgi:hypothetical protein